MRKWLSKPPSGIQLNRNHPLSQGIIGYWLFNERNGLRVNDLTGNENNGSLTDFEPFTTTRKWTGGKLGTSLQFDGSTSYVNCGNKDVLNPDHFSFAILLRPTSFPAAFTRISTKNRFNTLPRQGWSILFLNATGAVYISIYNSAGVEDNTSLTPIQLDTNKESLIVITYEGNQTMVYHNGILIVNMTPFTIQNATTSPLIIGAGDSDLVNSFSPVIIEFACYWNRFLNQPEVQSLYSQPFGLLRLLNKQNDSKR